MYCTQCGSELKERSQFCSACGRRIPPGPEAVSEGASTSPTGPRRVKKHYPMRTAALVLGLVTAAILLSNGWGACAYGGDPPTPVAQEGSVRIRLGAVITSWPRDILDPTIVEAGTLAVATGALLLGAAALANIALRTSLAVFGLALLGAVMDCVRGLLFGLGNQVFHGVPTDRHLLHRDGGGMEKGKAPRLLSAGRMTYHAPPWRLQE